MTKQEEWDKVLIWTEGDEHAAHCLRVLAESTQKMDDLTDETNVLTGEKSAWVVAVYDLLLVQLMNNPFWQKFHSTIMPVFMNGVVEWDCSNEWQMSDSKDTQTFGFVRRETMDAVVSTVAYIIGGRDWARQVAREVHEFYHVKYSENETPESWNKEVA